MPTGDPTLVIASGSTNGKMIPIAATATPGTTLHTVASGTATIDAVTIWLTNIHTATVDVTLELGGTAAGDQCIIAALALKRGMTLAVDSFELNNGLLVRAFAAVANVVNAKVRVVRWEV
jgi:hypothetical protein